MPSLPFAVTLITLKYIESYVYYFIYNAKVVSSHDLLSLSHGTDENTRSTVIIVDGTVKLKELKELVVTSIIHSHPVDGKVCSPHLYLTKYPGKGFFNNYWFEEENFNIGNHVYKWGEYGVYTHSELQQIITHIKEEKIQDDISPWSIVVVPLQLQKSAILFRCHIALKDLDLLSCFLQQRTMCNHVTKAKNLYDIGSIHFFINLCLATWNVMEYSLLSLKARKSVPSSCDRRIYRWSTPIDSKVFQEISKHLNVDVTNVILGCVAHVLINAKSSKSKWFLDKEGSSSFVAPSNSFYYGPENNDPVSTVMQTKGNIDDLSYSEKLFFDRLLKDMIGLILPVRCAFWFKPNVTYDTNTTVTTLLAEKKCSLVGCGVEMVSICGAANNKSGFEICLTNSLGMLVMAIETTSPEEKKAFNLFKEFGKVVNSLAGKTGVFTHYYK